MPDAFVLEAPAGSGWDQGYYQASWFGRDEEEGYYVCSGYGGSPLFLRCIKQEGDVITCVGEGTEKDQRYEYRMVEVDRRYPD